MGTMWRATVDGDLIHEAGPLAGFAAGAHRAVPLLIGWCFSEYAAIGSVPGAGPGATRAKAPTFLVPHLRGLVNALSSTEPSGCAAGWDALALEFFDVQRAALEARGRPADVRSVCLSAAGALWQVIPSMLTAAAHASSGGTVYVYEFDFPGKHQPEAVHGAELPFLWDFARDPETREHIKYAFGDPAERPGMATLADDMQSSWAAFARSGDPSNGAMRFPQLAADAEKRIMVLGRGEAAEHSAQLVSAEWASFTAFYEKLRAFAASSGA